jgi:hypothetical protein
MKGEKSNWIFEQWTGKKYSEDGMAGTTFQGFHYSSSGHSQLNKAPLLFLLSMAWGEPHL